MHASIMGASDSARICADMGGLSMRCSEALFADQRPGSEVTLRFRCRHVDRDVASGDDLLAHDTETSLAHHARDTP